MTEPQYATRREPDGRYAVVDQSHAPHIYPLPQGRYATEEEAEERAARYNGIMEGKL